MERELALDARCPACHAEHLTLRTSTEILPYLGDTLISSVLCGRCDFRHTTTMVLAQGPPKRYTFRFRAPQDLGVRVVRSNSGTYSVPELGFRAEPAEGSDAFVTNVEGILERVEDAVLRARLLVPGDGPRARAEEVLAQLRRIAEGREEATLVLEDPLGNSRILDDRAEVHDLTAEEAASLRSGVVFIDRADLEGPAGED